MLLEARNFKILHAKNSEYWFGFLQVWGDWIANIFGQGLHLDACAKLTKWIPPAPKKKQSLTTQAAISWEICSCPTEWTKEAKVSLLREFIRWNFACGGKLPCVGPVAVETGSC